MQSTLACRRPPAEGLSSRALAVPLPRLAIAPSPSADERLDLLVDRVRAQELQAFDELYRLTREEVARTLFHLVGARSDLEDLLQETYLRLLQAVPSFRGESKFRTFLYRICANVALMHLRWWRRRPEEPVADCPDRPSLAADPEAEAQSRQAARLVHQALSRLSAKKRIVFVYHELCEMGPEEIAQAVGSSYNTVRSRLHHARLEFTAEMQRLLAARPGGPHARP